MNKDDAKVDTGMKSDMKDTNADKDKMGKSMESDSSKEAAGERAKTPVHAQ